MTDMLAIPDQQRGLPAERLSLIMALTILVMIYAF